MRLQKYDSYKDSGVEWLGEIPSEWEVKKLKFLTKDILGGGTPSSSTTEYWTDNINNSYLWVSIADITKSEFIKNTKKYITNSGLRNCSAKIVPPYSILYSIYASLGKVAYSDKILTTNQAILSIIFKDKYYYKFMFYYLKTLTQVAVYLSNSTTQDNISLDILKNLTCSIPPLQEQQKIALFLDTKTQQLDKAIKQKEQLIKLLKERKQIVINEAVTKGLDKTVTMKDSGVEWIGKIPKHCEVKKLKYISKINKNSLDELTNKNYKFKYVDIGSVSFEKGILKTEPCIFKKAPSRARRLTNENDTIISTVRTYLKAIDFIDKDKSNFVYSTGFAVLEPLSSIIYPKYLTYIVKSNFFTNQVDIKSKGMSYPAINSTDLSNLFTLIPLFQEQKQIVNFIENQTSKIDNAIDLQQKQIDKLKEYKTSLIDSIVTGKVRVCDE